MSHPAYRIRQVRHQWGDAGAVLGPLDLEVAGGSFVGVLGPNGAGKTTLLRLLAGTLAPAGGSVLLQGQPLAELDRGSVARQVAFVPARNPVAFAFTALEVVLMGRAPHLGGLALEAPEDLALARRAMARAGVTDFEDRDMEALSSGERQRVIIARALAQSAQVFLLDEPTAHLDLQHQGSAYALFREEVVAGATVVAALHDPNLAALYCDRVLLLVAGQVVADGTPDQVLREETLRRAFDVDVVVTRHPREDVPAVLPVRAS